MRVIEADDPRCADIALLLDRHLEFAYASSPREHVHALDIDRLLNDSITFFSARDGEGELLGIGALKELDPGQGEIKSMHTAERARRCGVGSAILGHIIDVARGRGYTRLALETGTGPMFAAAHALYGRNGFTECEPFGEYTRIAHSVCMVLPLRSP